MKMHGPRNIKFANMALLQNFGTVSHKIYIQIQHVLTIPPFVKYFENVKTAAQIKTWWER
jgi:hypothetical protein